MANDTPEDDQQNKGQNGMGRGMLYVGWLFALAILTMFFGDFEQKQYNPNAEPQSLVDATGNREVILERNRMGHYMLTGAINGEAVLLLLDTGATNVSIPAHIAEDLNLQKGRQYTASTANGIVIVHSTKIDTLDLGNIRLYDVDASINPGMQTNEILLGMSALKQIEFTQRGSTLTLKQIN